MANSLERFSERDDTQEPSTERPAALTPQQESARGDGYRWASLDVTDLDPPTWFPPH